MNNSICNDLSEFFKVLGDATRIKLLQCLLDSEKCVSDLVEETQMSQSAVSHQLRVLRQSDFVKFRRNGKSVFYSLDDEHVAMLLKVGFEHVMHKNGYDGQE